MSYVQLLYHIVIRTKASRPVLSLKHSEKLYRYIWGFIKAKNGVLYRVNGIEDHLHMLVSLHPTLALSDFMRELKASTSKWLKGVEGFENFEAWGTGYAALTCNVRDKNTVINYIKKQREHHRKISFRDEYIEFLKEMELELDPRDWYR